jgi:glutamyl-tRNA synthetase
MSEPLEKKLVVNSTKTILNNNNVITYSSAFPELAGTVLYMLNASKTVSFVASSAPATHLPYMSGISGSISGDLTISKYLTRTIDNGSVLYGNGDAWSIGQIDQWLDLFQWLYLSPSNSKDVCGSAIIDILNPHLADKTFIQGQSLSLADIALCIAARKIGFKESITFQHMSRWYSLVNPLVPNTGIVRASASGGKGGSSKKEKTQKTTKAEVIVQDDSTGTCPPLEDAVDGEVCTRFPPEPSGYLHIGHCKAVLLNQYYAQRYKGKIIVRFDDTNPSKEKDEYHENIISDLKTLGVVADKVTNTSDSFDILQVWARKMISEGHAYMDNTDQETMQKERMELQESKWRNTDIPSNLKLFEDLLKGETAEAKQFCLRAKIDMKSVNGTMRDPVLYRSNDIPHMRTGTKYRAYPTYDFACPIVDSIEGVTHALRTTEYNDRDEQYHWIQNALKIRHVYIQAFGKMNFVHTCLSKRKLNWFVEEKYVEGWFDPRFPTIQGCIRRGMNVDCLKSFIIGQGASRRIITMEWDKFWALNKSKLEESSHRYMGVTTKDVVTLTVDNIDADITAVSVQNHPQKPEIGMRIMRKFNQIYIDQSDATTFKDGEEVTFLRWGNFFIDKIERDETGKVLSMRGRTNPGATNFSKTKKVTWVAAIPDLVPCKIFEFDHLISKAIIKDDENFKDFVNPNSKWEIPTLCDPCLRTVVEGQVIQLERKGFYRCDSAYGGPNKPPVLFAIPDGKKVKSSTPVALPKKDGKKK